MLAFTEGKCYSRKYISLKLGGDPVACLPHANSKTVAMCLVSGRNIWEEQEKAILVTTGPRKKLNAKIFVNQPNSALPGFVFVSTNKWRYDGLFRVVRQSTDPAELERATQLRRYPASKVIQVIWVAKAV